MPVKRVYKKKTTPRRKLQQQGTGSRFYNDVKRRAVNLAVGSGAQILYDAYGKPVLRRVKRAFGNASRRAGVPTPLGTDRYTQLAFSSVKKGQRLNDRQLVDRAVKATIERTVYQFRKYANDGTNTNNLGVDCGQVISSGKRYLPVYIVDLTRIVQPVNSYGSGGDAMKRMYMDTTGGDDGQVKWEAVQGIGADGSTASPNWFIAEDKAIAHTTLAGRQKPIYKSLMTWASIKLNLMGARARPGYYTVQIVKFDEEDLVDPWISSTENMGTFWTDFVSRLTCNTIHDLPKGQKRKMTVLMEKKLAWQPTSTTESDARAHVDCLNMFWRPNKTFVYQQGDTTTELDDDEKVAVTSNRSVVRGAGISDIPIKGKCYLLISAFCPYVDTSYNNAIHPSLEWNIKTSHVCLDS